MQADPEITQLFLQESAEHLEHLERQLLDLEDDPDDAGTLSAAFRSIHTIKGTSGFLGFARLEALAHAGEEVLAALRDGQLRLATEVTSALLALIDGIRTTLGEIERTGAEGSADHGATIARLRALAAEAEDEAEPVPEPPVFVATPAPSPPDAAEPPASAAAPPPTPPEATPEPAAAGDTTVRLGVAVLDRIMDLTGELVVLRSRLGAMVSEDETTPIDSIHRDLRVVTADLQAQVMRSRLQPVGVVLGRFRRIARDLATSLGKQVQVELSGEEVAVDRAINDALRGPLLHLVRNAVDHGLEPPDERVAAGKPPIGRLTIAASHARGRVRIDVADDGRGFDVAALRRRAVATGALSRADAETLSDRDVIDLALLPGVSTSEAVTTLSGRGVGLDVVSSVLGTVGGRIDITTEPGRGTRFSVNVPLTLAILPVLTVTCGGVTYCLPQANVLEVRHVEAEDSSVTDVDGVPIYRLRGRLLPLVDLVTVLAGGSARAGPVDRSGSTRVAILETDERRFALAVPATGDTLDVVVKPMTAETRGIGVFMGVSILADGRPALILDVAGIADAAHVTATSGAAPATDLPSAPAGESAIVVAEIDGGGRIAVRLPDVVRLERFDRAAVRWNGPSEAVMYDAAILPLVRAGAVLPERRKVPRTDSGADPDEAVPTIVCHVAGGLMGLVVRQILDVEPEPPAPSQPASRPGVIASFHLHDRFAELVDLEALAAAAGIRRSS